jgi:hypothetical protein
MRRWICGLGLLSLLLPLTWGCSSTEPALRPPKTPEEFIPPPNETWASRPIDYPKEALDGDPLLRKAKGPSTPGLTGRPGAAGQRPMMPGM